MEYVDAADARHMPGLKLALTVGVPGRWGESAKKVLEYKGIPYVPVAQYASEPNPELVAWTGCRNAPVAVWEDEPPRTNFQDIVALAERLKPEPRLVPLDPDERQLCLGISADICGEGGWGWKRRIIMGQRPRDNEPPDMTNPGLDPKVMKLAYGGSVAEAEIAEPCLAAMLDNFAARLERQRAAGSPYFVGETVTACDIHWACFSALFVPLPHDVNPMPDWLRASYSWLGPVLEQHRHQILLDHRDLMFERHLGLPLDY
ncbi:MAG: hypothetical protein O3B72_10750 [Proteobacteria bacterium]|nr:hypothetical protein [Pseudomonadota bacterium]